MIPNKLAQRETAMTHDFVTRQLAVNPDAIAPDGSEVRLLAATPRGSMAHFELPGGRVSAAVAHHACTNSPHSGG